MSYYPQDKNDYKLQDLKSIIVQIRDCKNEKIVGTGFVIEGGYILTCAHVVMAAGVNPCENESPPKTYTSFIDKLFLSRPFYIGQDTTEDILWIRFPKAKNPSIQDYRARVYACSLNEYEDDIVMLELVDSRIPVGVNYAKIGLAKPTTHKRMPEDRRFRSFGYRRLGEMDNALPCDGEVQDFIEMPSGRKLHQEPLQLLSNQISPGMSGAPILDIKRNLVIGLIAETWNAWNSSFHDRDTSFGTAMEVVQNAPFQLDLHDNLIAENTLDLSNHIFFDLNKLRNSASLSVSPQGIDSLEQLKKFPINMDIKSSILETWKSSYNNFHEIIYNGNMNSKNDYKLDDLLLDMCDSPEIKKPKRVLWWDVQTESNIEHILETILLHILGIKPSHFPGIKPKVSLINLFFAKSLNIFILNGLSQSSSTQDGENIEALMKQLIPNSSLCLLIK